MAQPIRLLLVDDEEKFLEYTSQYLQQQGVRCTTCTSVAECLERVGAEQFDVIASDLVMPDNSNLDFVKELTPKINGAQIIIMTAYPSVETAVGAVNLPVFAYLLKPLEPGELLKQIRAAYARTQLLQIVRNSHERLRKWQKDVNTLEQSIDGGHGPDSTPPLEAFLGLSFANIISSLSDISHVVDALVTGERETQPCALLNCPRLREQVELIRHAIGVLDKTKRSFKSKELGELRRHMEEFLAAEPAL